MRSIGIGILGAAGITERAIVEPARELDGVRVVAIGARDAERARETADRLGVPDAGDYAAVLANPAVDLVYIPLPSTVQAEWAVRALEAGKHVLCEKPLTANATSAAAVAAAAARTGRRAFVGFHYRLHGFTCRLLEVLRSGTLGDIRRVDIDFSIPHFVVKPGNIRLDADLGGGSFMDVGCYAVDLVRAAWGEPTVVSAESVLYKADPRVDLQTDAALELPGGISVSIRSSFIGDDQGSMALRVEGSAASLVATSVIVPQWGAVLSVTAGEDVLLEEKAVEGENSYARQLEQVVAALRTGEPSELDAALGVGTMAVVDAVYRAAGLQPR
ncbi:Gfo/Idh/MocA family oxidoreductase [Microbacterium sp. CFH 31415]|jgi:predicted dehydrogenase|uniref:Gfo/Idh/MocA family protein n=1 Tax=Microbacterium sp. CFH 31415 TaxID=2921732 RepID=UPI001F12A865|nr:Gfo/Idh/MocA family oxidoreductase [Microbacterium sp. CFH 31415]MCH6230929.1 Gfo/Idh/MocA family oxidoreductase [Microbacterium sp. CFH 31415]